MELNFSSCENDSCESLHSFIGRTQFTIFISHCKSDKEEWDKYLLYKEYCCSTNTLLGIFDSFDDAVLKVKEIIKENIPNIKSDLQNQLDLIAKLEEEMINGK